MGAFVLKLTNESLQEKKFELPVGESIRIGRDKKCNFPCMVGGVSNTHFVIKACAADGDDAEAQLKISDMSMNGTSIERSGAATVRLIKETDTPLLDDSTLVFPMKLKKGESGERLRLLVTIVKDEAAASEKSEKSDKSDDDDEPAKKEVVAKAADEKSDKGKSAKAAGSDSDSDSDEKPAPKAQDKKPGAPPAATPKAQSGKKAEKKRA